MQATQWNHKIRSIIDCVESIIQPGSGVGIIIIIIVIWIGVFDSHNFIYWRKWTSSCDQYPTRGMVHPVHDLPLFSNSGKRGTGKGTGHGAQAGQGGKEASRQGTKGGRNEGKNEGMTSNDSSVDRFWGLSFPLHIFLRGILMLHIESKQLVNSLGWMDGWNESFCHICTVSE
jgi:hypothetical protein